MCMIVCAHVHTRGCIKGRHSRYGGESGYIHTRAHSVACMHTQSCPLPMAKLNHVSWRNPEKSFTSEVLFRPWHRLKVLEIQAKPPSGPARVDRGGCERIRNLKILLCASGFHAPNLSWFQMYMVKPLLATWVMASHEFRMFTEQFSLAFLKSFVIT